MFRISYISESGEILHKAGFKSDKEAYEWIDAHKEIVPLKLLIWSEARARALEMFSREKYGAFLSERDLKIKIEKI